MVTIHHFIPKTYFWYRIETSLHFLPKSLIRPYQASSWVTKSVSNVKIIADIPVRRKTENTTSVTATVY